MTSAEMTKIKADLKILNLGCGNSIICEEMYDEGYHSITSNDYSESCINYMI